MLKIQTLASGSRGNATIISSETTRIVVDIGLGIRVMTARLGDANINPASIDAVVVTHEHRDHIHGVGAFARRFGTPVFIPSDAFDCFSAHIGRADTTAFSQSVEIGDITVTAFPVPHDSQYCFGYTFSYGEAKIAYATDLGVCNSDVIDKMAGSQIVLLESNHDTTKLANNVKYPSFLKRRIAGNHGHLSNVACATAVLRLACLGTKQVVLAHLSEENNSPTLAHRVVADFLQKQGLQENLDIKIHVAQQDEVGEMLSV